MPFAPLVFSAKTLTLPSSPTLWIRLLAGSLKNISPLSFTAGPSVMTMTLADELPVFAGHQRLEDVLPRLAFGVGLDRRRPVAPQPAQRVGKDRRRVPRVVLAVAPLVAHVVAGVLERRQHVLVGDEPAAGVVVQVVPAVLQEDANRLRLGLADQHREAVAAAQAHVGADGAEHAPERVGPLPGGDERRDGAAAVAGDRAVVRIGRQRQAVRLRDVGQHLVDQEARVVVAHRVVLEAAVHAIERVGGGRLHPAVHHEHADHRRHRPSCESDCRRRPARCIAGRPGTPSPAPASIDRAASGRRPSTRATCPG